MKRTLIVGLLALFAACMVGGCAGLKLEASYTYPAPAKAEAK